MTNAEFDAVSHLLKISEERIKAARAFLVNGETYQVIADRHGCTRQAVGGSVNAVWEVFENYKKAQSAAANANASLPDDWEEVTLVAPRYLIEKFKRAVFLVSQQSKK